MTKYIFLLLTLLPLGNSEDSKEAAEAAEALLDQGHYLEAAEAYEAAWLLDELQTALLVKAGDAYQESRAYQDAARMYETALMDGSNAEHLQYKLGVALKQSGQYRAALDVLNEALQLEDRANYLFKRMITAEIKGCEMALAADFSKPSTSIFHLSRDFNSSSADYAAMPVTGNMLYFASMKSGNVQVYQSSRSNNNWSKPSVANELMKTIKGKYSGGTFNKDMTEFYFSICDEVPTPKAVGKNCKIHKSSKSSRGWSTPKAMRSYINWEGSNTTHPTIVYEGDTEVLYFATDRAGGQGGMDIWYATREVNSDDVDFTFPENAGAAINTIKDDITPFYDRSQGTLYFSSNGHPGAGGLDVFQANGKRNVWSSPTTLGNPVNSGADDYFFAPKMGSGLAYLTSNRTLPNGKKQAGDDDIFELNFAGTEVLASTTPNPTRVKRPSAPAAPRTTRPVVNKPNSRSSASTSGAFNIKGTITDATGGSTLKNAYVTVYKGIGESKRKRIDMMKATDGKYSFNLAPGEYYILEAFTPGYQEGEFEFNTEDLDSGISIDIPLSRAKGYASRNTTTSSSSRTTTGRSTTSRPSAPATRPSSSTSTASTSTYRPATAAPTPRTYADPVPSSTHRAESAYSQGTEFRIQLTAVRQYDPMLPIFSNARKYGTLGTELHPNGQLTRVFLRSFSSYNQAKTLVDTMKSYGFDTAFVVKYQDGQRVPL